MLKKFSVIFVSWMLVSSQGWCVVTKTTYGTSNQQVSIAHGIVGSATGNVWAMSSNIDNVTPACLDVLVQCNFQELTANGSTSTINVYAYGTAGGFYTGGATTSSATITNPSLGPTNAIPLGVVLATGTPTGGYTGGPWSIAQKFGVVPSSWGILINNSQQGGTSDAGGGCYSQCVTLTTQ